MRPRNDRALALSAFCLEIETYRRTPEGRVRNADAFLAFYFSRAGGSPTDRVFSHLPPAVRGPIIAAWGIRGQKAALRDDDERVRTVVFDALEAGDLDAKSFEEGLTPEVMIDWTPLDEWWSLWRGTTVPNGAVQKALAAARALHLIDDRWFFENVEGRGGKLKATDAICDTLSKDEITGWLRGIHQSGDGTPAGLVAARTWDAVLAKTSPEALLFALDAFARKVHLTSPKSEAPKPLSAPPLDGFEGMPAIDLHLLAEQEANAGATANPSWPAESDPPLSARDYVGDADVESVRNPEVTAPASPTTATAARTRPPPLPK